MTDVLFAAVIVVAVLAGSFTELFFRKVWPLIELSVRRRLQQPAQETDRHEELASLRARIEALERSAPGA